MDGSQGFQGAHRGVRRWGGFTLTEATYPAGQRLPLHAHASPFFALLLSGSYTETLERGQRRSMPTSLTFYPAGIPHADHFDGNGGRAFLVEMSTATLESIDEGRLTEDADRLGEIGPSRLGLLALRLYATFVRRAEDSPLAGEELGLEMLAELRALRIGRERRPPAWLKRVRDRIHAEFRMGVRVADLATGAGVHPVYLARVFRRYQGCGVGEYVQRLRVQQACAAILGSDETLSCMAARLGYADQSHFTRRFGASLGVPPGRFRTCCSRDPDTRRSSEA